MYYWTFPKRAQWGTCQDGFLPPHSNYFSPILPKVFSTNNNNPMDENDFKRVLKLVRDVWFLQ